MTDLETWVAGGGRDKNPIYFLTPHPDPSVTQLTNTSQSGLDEFNPFSESSQLVSLSSHGTASLKLTAGSL
uniref:Uncharacterized protein n=1 Tax=Athene cunicularia TaxID=194338 RepID=A0A663MBJ0_ATHCN